MMKRRVEKFLLARTVDGGAFYVEDAGDGSAIVRWRSDLSEQVCAAERHNLQRCADTLLGYGFRFRADEDHRGAHIRVTMGGRA